MIQKRHVTWREHARGIVARVLRENEGRTDSEIRDALRKAYPYGQRAHYPYQVWCDEIARQRGFKPPRQRGPRGSLHKPDPRQAALF